MQGGNVFSTEYVLKVMQKDEQRNIILAIVLSMAILLGFNILTAPSEEERLAQRAAFEAEQAQRKDADLATPQLKQTLSAINGTTADLTAPLDRADALQRNPRVQVETPNLVGSISLRGGRIDDLTLRRYFETIQDDSAQITLLSPVGSAAPYYAEFGWLAVESSVAVPSSTTLWQTTAERLTPASPLVLFWNNGAGLRFEREISVDDNFLFTVKQRVVNEGTTPVDLAPYSLISRTETPETLGFYILHEGPIGVLGGSLVELNYDDLHDDKLIQNRTTGGWIGITDQYWLSALIPDQTQSVQTRFVYTGKGAMTRYQSDYFYDPVTVAAGQSTSFDSNLFLGAKEVTAIDNYQRQLQITDFDLAVDFGWFYYITKPMFFALHWITGVVGNVGVAILILTLAIKVPLFPLANKSYASMAKMRKLTPKMMTLRERYGDDKQKLNQEMMALYRQEKVNPAAGCLPILIQIPIFFSLYKVLFVTLEMRHAPFFGWIQDLSAPDPTSIINGFGLFPWAVPELGLLGFINLGVWPILMGVSMFLQQRLNPQPADPVQAKVFMLMPFFFTFLLATFPAGLVIYWTWNNLLSIIQQAVIMKKAGVPLGRQPES